MKLSDFNEAQFIALETFRKNGQGVITPVWVTAEEGRLFVWTGADSWKVKRIRNNPRVRLCESDARGNPRSDWMEAQASILEDPAEEKIQQKRLSAKYGLQFRLMSLMNRITGNRSARTVLEIRPLNDRT